jgi:uncharacterized iron-regulated membrane protein
MGMTLERLYLTLWRWHFYAGLICAPILLIVSITGAVYVFREEIDRFWWAQMMQVIPSPTHIPLSEQCRAALNAMPGATLTLVHVPDDPTLATRFSFRIGPEDSALVFVDPGTGAVTGTIDQEKQWFWRLVLDLHRRLGGGQAGRIVVELATSWGLMLILTGLCLWWPRHARGLWGAWLPRVGSGLRVFFKDLHAVAGLYVSCVAFVTLFTGLFFTKYFRPYFSSVTAALGLHPEGKERKPVLSGDEGVMPVSIPRMLAMLERDISRPFSLSIPATREGERDPRRAFVVRVGAIDDPSRRHGIHFDQGTGEQLGVVDQWKDMSFVRRLIYSAYPVHVGSIFGMATKVLAVAVCAGVALLSATGMVMWWLRRPRGRSGWVARGEHRKVSLWLILAIGAMGLVFPVLGASLICFAVVDAAVSGARFWSRKTCTADLTQAP